LKACATARRFGHNTDALSNSLLIVGASQILTLRGRGPRRGKALSNLGVINDGALLIRDGRIVSVGVRAKVEALPEAKTADNLCVGGRVILPGFVDSHTHLVHAASRAEEYELKIAGASYEEIARKGGGILNSVKSCGQRHRSLEETGVVGSAGIRGERNNDAGSKERIWTGRHERVEDSEFTKSCCRNNRWRLFRHFWERMWFPRNTGPRRGGRSATCRC
jgi:hypothetical protein